MSAVVDVVPSDAHITERLTKALLDVRVSSSRGALRGVLAPSTRTFERFLSEVFLTACPAVRVASPLVERLIVAGAVRAVLRSGRKDEARPLESAVASFAHALEQLRLHRLSPDDITASEVELLPDDDEPRRRLALLSAVLGRVDATLEARGLLSASAMEDRVARVLDTAVEQKSKIPLPEYLLDEEVHIRFWCVPWADPARVAFFRALARVVGLRGGRVEVHLLCEPRRERLPAGIERALRGLENVEAGDVPLELQFSLRDPFAIEPVAPLVALVDALATGGSAANVPISVAEAAGPEEEARWVAARVDGWLRAGLAPEEIAVVVREPTHEALDPVRRALDEARVPFREESTHVPLERPFARAALSLPSLAARGAPCEETFAALAVLVGHTPVSGRPAPYRVASALRALRVRSLEDVSLEERLRKNATAPALEVAREALLLRDLFRTLRADGTIEQHCSRLEQALRSLGCDDRHGAEARSVLASAGQESGARTVLRAAARDEQARSSVYSLLQSLPEQAHASARAEHLLDAAAFAELLLDGAGLRSLHRPLRMGRGVLLTGAEAIVGRSVRALAIVGVNEGAFPALRREDGPYGDAERRAILRARGVLLPRSGGREEETLKFLSVLSCATERVVVSGARHEVNGRLRPPSPFLAELRRVLARPAEWIPADPLALSARVPARGPERLVRAAASAMASLAGREGAAELALTAKLRSVVAPEGLERAVASANARTRIELERKDFFAGRVVSAGKYTGRVAHDPEVLSMLELTHWGGARRPVAVTTLERTARCAFKAFASEMLRLEPEEEQRVTLDSKERGHLLHSLLEAGQLALRGVRGLPAEQQWGRVSAALDKVGEKLLEEEVRADRDLLRADLVSIRRQVEVWLARRMAAQEEDRWEVLATEIAFGPRDPWPALEVPVEAQEPILIVGRVDGVERMDDDVRVVEFKTGRGDGFRKRLREGVLDTQFQLVVYTVAAAKARARGELNIPSAPGVDGVYVGFRDEKEFGLRETLERDSVNVDALVREGAAGTGALAEAIRRAVLPVREGVFAPRPRDCDFCRARSLCRVELEGAGAGE